MKICFTKVNQFIVDQINFIIKITIQRYSTKIMIQKPEEKTVKRAPKPKFESQKVDPLQFQSQHSISNQQQEAYDQLMSKWKHRQRQSIRVNQLNSNTYTFDPNNPDFSVYQKPVSEEREDIFAKYTQEICKYLKAKFVVEEIIEPIREEKVFDNECIWTVQLLYLFSFRAWCEINAVLRTFNQKKINIQSKSKSAGYKRNTIQKIQFVFNPSDANLKYLVQPMIKLATKIDVIFEFYHRTLTLRQHYFANKVKAFFELIFHREQKKTHDKYLCGFEGLDFTRDEQIQYVNSKYIPAAVNQLKDLKGIKYEHLIQKMNIFKKLMLHKFVKIQGYDDFETLKKSLMKQQKQLSQIQLSKMNSESKKN